MIRIPSRFALLAIAGVMLGGCSKPSWQKVLWDDGFIPLPTLAVLRIVEPDSSQPEKYKLVTKNVLVGAYREARAEDFNRDAVPWTWSGISQLTETGLPVRLTGGAEKYVDKIGLKFDVQALLGAADLSVELGPSRSLQLNQLWFLEAAPVSRSNFHLVLRPLVTELAPAPQKKTFFLLTRVLGGDIGEQADLTVKAGAKPRDEKFPVKVDVGGGSNWEFKGQGVALGVQGQIMTREFRGVTVPPRSEKWIRLSPGQNVFDFGDDRIFINRDRQNRLTIEWARVPDVEIFARAGRGELQRVDAAIPANASYILLGDLKPSEGRLLALQLGSGNDGGPVILAGATYTLSLKNLDAQSLRAHFAPGPADAAGETGAAVDRSAWAGAIGNDALLNEFLPVQQNILAIRQERDEGRIARYEIAEAFAPVAGNASQYDLVRVTRYDVRGLGGKTFTHEVYRGGAVGIVRARLWAQTSAGAIEDITPNQQSFTSSRQSIVIPQGVDYLYVRGSVRHDRHAMNMIGFHGGRQHGPVKELKWDAAFVAPLGAQCRLLLGEATPEAPILPERRRGSLPAWALRIFAMPAEEAEAEVRTLQALAGSEFEICRFSVGDSGSKVVWMVHSAP